MGAYRSIKRGVQRRAASAILEPDALCMVFQPVVECASGECRAFEALARFPQLGMPPDMVFAAAHAHGIGHELEALAIHQALLVPDRPAGSDLCINVSPSLLASELLWSVIPDDLHDLIFEITEHELCPDDQQLSAALAELRARGARIAVDDVGSGYSGLCRLIHVRPEVVKVDRVLIAGIHADQTRLALIAGLVRFAEQSGAELWAEGVEDRDDLAVLIELGVHAVQGFLIGRPGAPWIAPAAMRADAGATSPYEIGRPFTGTDTRDGSEADTAVST